MSGILQHKRAVQRIASNNDETRALGTPGYAASAAYVEGRLQKVGYIVSEQEFNYRFYKELRLATT